MKQAVGLVRDRKCIDHKDGVAYVKSLYEKSQWRMPAIILNLAEMWEEGGWDPEWIIGAMDEIAKISRKEGRDRIVRREQQLLVDESTED